MAVTILSMRRVYVRAVYKLYHSPHTVDRDIDFPGRKKLIHNIEEVLLHVPK